MNGTKKSQRLEFYLKYRKSDIFDDEDPQFDKSQNVTSKVNSIKCAYKFKPFDDGLDARERYLKQYWNVDPKKFSKKNGSNLTTDTIGIKENDFIKDDCGVKLKNKMWKNPFSSRRQYVKEFLTNNVFQDPCSEVKNNSMKMNRSKSVMHPRLDSCVSLDGEGGYKTSRFKKIDFLTSDVFNIKDKETILNKSPELSTEAKDSQSSTISTCETHRTRIEKSRIPSAFDWRYTNIELGTKSHIIRSKTIDPNLKKQQDLLSHFEEDDKKHEMILSPNRIINKEMFTPIYALKSIDIRPNRNMVQKLPEDKEVEFYELHTKENFDIVDCNKIKRMFLSNGIHMYGFEEDGLTVDGFQSGKISFRIRKDKNDQEVSKKMNLIGKEINSLGLKMKKIVKDTHFKKERKPTPGTELLKKAKKKNAPPQEKMKNIKPQCDIQYKNNVSYKKKQVPF